MDSKALRLGIACVALLGLAACGGNNPPVIVVTDSGTADAGTPGVDSGLRPDSGPPAGTCEANISATAFPPLPAACMPRCAASTATAINACPADDDGTCLNAALEGDTTPSTAFRVNGMAQPDGLDCGGCFGFQQLSCAFDSCPDETVAYLSCDPMAGSCDAQNTALNACIMADATAFQACANTRINMCFGAGGGAGFFPLTQPSVDFEALPWSSIDANTIEAFRAAIGF